MMGAPPGLLFIAVLLFISMASATTDPGDFAVLDEFRKGLSNSELLDWPTGGGDDDPCGNKWPHIFCSGSRVTQIQVQGMQLSGTLPQDLNKLSMLVNVGLQKNNFTGKLPSFRGLSQLQYAFLDYNLFDEIPSDFFVGLSSLQVLAMDDNPLNRSSGWVLPLGLQNSAQLMNLSLMNCNLVGALPPFLGSMSSLSALRLSYNNLTGEIPASLSGSSMKILWLNNQQGDQLTGSIDVITSMLSLTDVWLHGNAFSGKIPSSIGALSSLTRLWLNNNRLVGLVPENITALPQLQSLQLGNNMLMGPIPDLVAINFTYTPNSFCQSAPGVPCSPQVMALLGFLDGVNYPSRLASSWTGNDPCDGWPGVTCLRGKVSVLNLPNSELNGTISASLGSLDGLVSIVLGGNNLTGAIPRNLTGLKLLKLLDVSSNNLEPPVPKFSDSVILRTVGNTLLESSSSSPTPMPPGMPPGDFPPGGRFPPGNESHSGNYPPGNNSKVTEKSSIAIFGISIAIGISIVILAALLLYCYRKRKGGSLAAPSSIFSHPNGSSHPGNILVKSAAADRASSGVATSDLCSSTNYSGTTASHILESGNLSISVQVLRDLTQDFSPKNELGRGGFGVVYKGELHDGTMIAVKRMESVVISTKALDEFQSEIAVLSKVRHRNLVSLLGYSVEGSERLLVYEYMPKGALNKHLFHWEELNWEPLTWKRRLNIALDVARGVEYLHTLAHHCFIHRDLKPSNILLDENYRAKVSDFGLVKLAPDGKYSMVTRLAGTFGYVAPEYAVTGKITTKADVFSFGVVLMELITGLTALDESRPEEKRYLASWFCQMKSKEGELEKNIDGSIELTEETFASVSIVAELAGHCAAREPHQRPDMGHAVNVLAPLVEKWKPANNDPEEYLGIDLGQPLLQMVKGWQDADGTRASSLGFGFDDSKESIPPRPAGLAESFTSADGR